MFLVDKRILKIILSKKFDYLYAFYHAFRQRFMRNRREYKKYIEHIYPFTFLDAHGWRSIVETEEKEQKKIK